MMGQIWAFHPTAVRTLLKVTVAGDVLAQLMWLSANLVGRDTRAAGNAWVSRARRIAFLWAMFLLALLWKHKGIVEVEK